METLQAERSAADLQLMAMQAAVALEDATKQQAMAAQPAPPESDTAPVSKFAQSNGGHSGPGRDVSAFAELEILSAVRDAFSSRTAQRSASLNPLTPNAKGTSIFQQPSKTITPGLVGNGKAKVSAERGQTSGTRKHRATEAFLTRQQDNNPAGQIVLTRAAMQTPPKGVQYAPFTGNISEMKSNAAAIKKAIEQPKIIADAPRQHQDTVRMAQRGVDSVLNNLENYAEEARVLKKYHQNDQQKPSAPKLH